MGPFLLIHSPFVLVLRSFHSGNEIMTDNNTFSLSGNKIILRCSPTFHSGNDDHLSIFPSALLGNGSILPNPASFHSGNEEYPLRIRDYRSTFVPFPKWNPAAMGHVEGPKDRKMNVTCIRAGVKDLSSGDLVAKASYVLEHMEGNPHFPDPNPSLASIAAATTALQLASAEALGRARQAVVQRWLRHAELERLLVYLAKYVMSAAPGDIGKQITSGFEPRNPPLRITDPGAPAAFTAKRSSFQGAVKLTWGRVHGARTYQVYVNAGDPADPNAWQPLALCTRIRTDVHGLAPGHLHHFRVRAILAMGEGPFSQVASARAA